MILPKLTIDETAIAEYAEQHHIAEMYVFGSALRDDFNDSSDIDILVSFDQNTEISYFDILEVKRVLSDFFNRKVDLVEKEALVNPYRKKEIFRT